MQSRGGLLGIDSIEVVEPEEINEDDARRAGYHSLEELLGELADGEDGLVYRVRFHRIGDDPRVALRNDDQLSAEDVAGITMRLQRLDRASSHGPWTGESLDLIERFPGRRAPDLAAMVGRETQAFKIDVRKLKALGLTESLDVGYRLSPRGVAYRKASGRDR